MKSIGFLASVVLGFVLFFCAGYLFAASVHLVDMTATPASAVVFSEDGLSATLYEDTSQNGLGPVSLENPDYPIPAEALSLSFDYNFHIAAGGRDFFDFYIGNTSEPVFELGGQGPSTASDHFVHDLAGLTGMTVPIVFDLIPDWGDQDFNSYITISNVEVSLVPIPAALLLLGTGILVLLGLKGRQVDCP